MRHDLVQLSKTISHALRHAPEQYGLTLDKEGWVAVPDLLIALHRRRKQWEQVQEADLLAIMAQSDKQRFELKDGKIRAYYGHSIVEKIERAPSAPPPVLYHGTTSRAAEAILREGLKPMNRQYVHLSADRATAIQVARRRTNQPAILKIATDQAQQAGVTFYLGNESVWLAAVIPAQYITLDP
jgi:putative RNA 2'-phosphotransferase